MDRARKSEITEELFSRFAESQVALLADFTSLSVAEATELRRNLKECGSKVWVVKNTLAKLAAEKAYGKGTPQEVERLLSIVQGPSMFITNATNPVAPAKVLADFMKAKSKLSMKGAWLDGKFLDAAGVKELSQMPGLQETLAKLLALIQTPAIQLARLVATPGTQVARVLDAHREKMGTAA